MTHSAKPEPQTGVEPKDEPDSSPRSGARLPAGRKARRRKEILQAAMSVFSEQGFAAARLDDVADKAGVAKGTLYLYFRDKESLFDELLREAATPVLGRLARVAADPRLSFREALERLFETVREVMSGDTRKVFMLMIAEGSRFPAIADFYYREVISRAMPMLREKLKAARDNGEIACDDLVDHPQLVMAPVVTALIWDSLFAKHTEIDLESLLATHINLLTGKPNVETS